MLYACIIEHNIYINLGGVGSHRTEKNILGFNLQEKKIILIYQTKHSHPSMFNISWTLPKKNREIYWWENRISWPEFEDDSYVVNS